MRATRLILIFGLGYTATRIADRLRSDGWDIVSTGSAGSIRFDDAASVRLALANATHILSSIPPMADGDPVLNVYGDAIEASPAQWIGYLSSTGVYGDVGGAWVDEAAPIRGRRGNRNDADADWTARGARVFRLPGIYGPGRSALDRVAEGKAHRIDLPNQVFSRIHVDDIVSGVVAGMDGPPGAYNLSDDLPCSQNRVIEAASEILGHKPICPRWHLRFTRRTVALPMAKRSGCSDGRCVIRPIGKGYVRLAQPPCQQA
jgi:hypothetical protein